MPVERTDLIPLKRGGVHHRAEAQDLPRLAIPAPRALLDGAAALSGLEPDTVYWLTDENRLAVATSASAWQAMAKQGEGGGSGAISAVEIDFAAPASAAFFERAVPGAAAGQKVMAQLSPDMPAGVAEDELEMDPMTVCARVSAPGVVRIFAAACNGGILGGKRAVNLQLI